MRIEEAICYGKEKVHSDFAKILLSDLLGKNPLELYLCLEEEVPINLLEQYKKEIQALQEGTPIQYAIGHVQFFNRQFYVDKNVLIPRFETEELVEKALEYIQQIWEKDFPLHILDLGCGSGVIGLTLQDKLPSSTVELLDISEKALNVAKKNSETLQIPVLFHQGDFLENLESSPFDIIISNPPYIREDEEIEEIVKKNEPALALYGGKDGLSCYRKILQHVNSYLKEKFLLAFEIGETQKDSLTELVKIYLKDVEIECLKDLQGRDRMLFVYRKGNG